jgi:DNA-binding transcriptional ArsR family regulator
MNPTELFALLPDMAVFARVVDAGNFSVAARQLGSTPSTVSRQIKRLEEALATRLLERSTRKVRVTESGAQVYRYCRDMVGAASGAVDAAGQLVGRPQGKVSVSAPTAYAKTVIHPLIPGFLRAYAEVGLRNTRLPASRVGGSVRCVGYSAHHARICWRAAHQSIHAILRSTIACTWVKPPTTIAGACAAAQKPTPSR